jgi:hypothetical protein
MSFEAMIMSMSMDHGAFDFGIYNCMYRKCELKLTRAESISKAINLLVCSLLA